MSLAIKDEDRWVVPRWRDSIRTFATGELLPSGTPVAPTAFHQDYLDEKIDEWHAHPTPTFASDLVAAGFVLGHEEDVQEAAQFLLAHPTEISEPAANLAHRVLNTQEFHKELENRKLDFTQDDEQIDEFYKTIHGFKRRLRDEPRNALLWVDLSRQYSMLGQAAQSARAMNAGIALAPNNRFTLRSAARLYVHLGQPDHGHDLLQRSGVAKKDPWLLAAEIAVGGVAGRTSRNIKRAKGILRSDDYPPLQISELASAVATLELNAGNYRVSRRLFQQALEEPTDNSVAQANWALQRLPGLNLDPRHIAAPRSFEARAWHHYYAREWSDALAETYDWFNDEPFSARPGTLGSFITGFALEEYATSAAIAQRSLVSNPNDQSLRNNLVFALASANKITEAETEYRKMQISLLDTGTKILWLATGGLVEFRKGRKDEGRKLYRRAIELAVGPSFQQYRSRAAAYWAREEFIAMSAEAPRILELAVKEAARQTDPDANIVIDRITKRYIAKGQYLITNPKNDAG